MNAWLEREKYKDNTRLICIELLDAIISDSDYSHLISKLKDINLNVFRIGRVNKYKALYNWVFPANWDEEGIKLYNPKADYKYIKTTIEDICKRIIRNEL